MGSWYRSVLSLFFPSCFPEEKCSDVVPERPELTPEERSLLNTQEQDRLLTHYVSYLQSF